MNIPNQNTSDSGLSGIEDNCPGEFSDKLNKRNVIEAKKTMPTVLLNRPATLDLKPSFINTSKQSEGIYNLQVFVVLPLAYL